MRENSQNFAELTSLKKQFSLALENKDYQEANEVLDKIDNVFLKVSGKTFRSNLTNESQERLEQFLKNNGEKKP
ncbi:MAG: hypothetical protein IJ867_06270 [Clostridia bacterium]|nr:hypothetical protein [Clostridia bacterium]